MAEEELRYGVRLEDHVSAPAHEASKSLGHLSQSAHEARGGMLALAHEFIRTVEPAEVLRHGFERMGEGLREFASGLKSGEAKEAIAGLVTTIAGLATTLDLVVPGLGQVAAAAIKVAGGFAAMTVGLIQSGAELAIEATMAKQSMIDMFAALGGGVAVGRETEEMLGSLSRQIGVTKDDLAPFVAKFMAMGVEGEEALEKMTRAAMSAQAIMRSPAAAEAFENLTKKIQVAVQTGQGLKIPAKGLGSLAEMGIRVDDVAQRMNISANQLAKELKAGTVNAAEFGEALQTALVEKGAGPLQRAAMSLTSIRKMLGQSFEDMFEDMGRAVEPFMVQIKDMASIFNENRALGIELKAAIGGAFTFIFDTLKGGILPLKHFFLQLGIWSLQAYIAIKQNWTELRYLFIGIRPVIDALAGSFRTIGETIDKFFSILDTLQSLKTGAAGMGHESGNSLVKGIQQGILDGLPDLKNAGNLAAASAKAGVDEHLQIHSPSRVMFQRGRFATMGMALGMVAATPHVQNAGERVGNRAGMAMTQSVAEPIRMGDYRPAAMQAQPSADVGKGVTVHGGIRIEITAPNGVTSAVELTEHAVAALFERIALQQGAT